MKRIFNLAILIIINLLLLISCKENCIECTDNISAENKKIPYQNKELVAFKNDTLGLVYDTVYVNFGIFSDCIKKESYQTYEDLCSKSTLLNFSNKFNLHIYQSPNIGYNSVYYNNNDDWIIDIITDSSNILINNNNFKVIHYYFPVDSLNSKIWTFNKSNDSSFVYNDYYVIQNDTIIKLLQYTTVYKDGKRRVWRLQE